MSLQVVFHPAAEAEMIAAAHFYESKVRNLGSDFLDEIEHYCQLIAQRPQIGAGYLNNTRRLHASRFPYSIVYRIIEEEQIQIIAIAHQHRKPDYWKNKR